MGKFKVDLKATKESHEKATERALKCIRMDQSLQFQRKGHEEQYHFNADIQDHLVSASKQLEKLAPQDKEKPIVEKAMKELKEGLSSLTERQKRIRFADQVENGWDAVAKYIGYSFADDEEDDRKLDSSDRAAGVKKWWKVAANAPKPKRFPVHREYGYPQRGCYEEEYGPPHRSHNGYPEFQGYGPPNQHVATRLMPYRRQRGPCYQCGQLGYIRANCPNCRPTAKEYTFKHASIDSMKECVDSVCDQGVVNTVSVGSEGHCNSSNMKFEAFNTSCMDGPGSRISNDAVHNE